MSDYRYWTKALNGENPPIHDGDPQAGFYYKRDGDNPRIPVAIWYDETRSGMVALVGQGDDRRSTNPNDIWTWVCQTPVTHDHYRAVQETGIWPDDPPVAVVAATSDGEARPNEPEAKADDDPAIAIKAELDAEAEMAAEFLAVPVTTKDRANMVSVWSKKMADLAKRSEVFRKAQKEPHLTAGREVDAKWNEILDVARDLVRNLKKHVEPYLIEQKRIDDERRAADDKKARDLEKQAAKEAATHGEKAAEDLNRQAKEARDSAKTARTGAGRTGAKVTLRTVTSAKITSYKALLSALANDPEIKALVETLANRAARAGKELPGMEIETTEKAV